MGFLADPVGTTSDTISHVGQVVSTSPIAQAVITAGGAYFGIPPSVTAAVLGANQTSQTGDIGQGLLSGGLSYLGGTAMQGAGITSGGANSASSMWGQYAPSWAGGAASAAEQTAADALISQGYSPSAAWEVVNAGGTGAASTVGATAASGASTGLGSLWSNLTSTPNLLAGGMQLAGSYLNQNAASDAAATQAQAQIRAAQIAADAAKFRPVGVTTNFGKSNFGYDANGNLISAGYALNPLLQGQQNQLMGASQGLLNQFTGAQSATAPMGDAAQRMMSLGNQYLATDPQAQAAKYLSEQQGLLAPGRADEMAKLQAQLQAQGRGGFAIGGGVNGQGAANPQMQALYNARMQQDAQLAAQATQGGMDYAKFGSGMVGSGGNMLRDQYGTQSAAYNPYSTALGGAQYIEGLGQNAMDIGINIGAKGTAASAQSGLLQAQGMTNAANTMAPVNAQSPWGNLLSGGAQALSNYKWGT